MWGQIMDNESVKSMDPNMLLSIVNMKLRDFYSNLDDMCEDLDLDKQNIENKLDSEGYIYLREQNKFIFKQ